jgi:hypothetical protein
MIHPMSSYFEHYRLQLFSNFTYYELRPDAGDQFAQQEARNVLGGQFVKGWTHNLFGSDSTTEVGVQVRHDNIHVQLLNLPLRPVERRVPLWRAGVSRQLRQGARPAYGNRSQPAKLSRFMEFEQRGGII